MELQGRKRFETRIHVPVDREMMQDIDAIAGPVGASVASVVRAALKRGLPLLRESQRKARTRQRTQERTQERTLPGQ